ncbi:tetratricopeptide repeat-containing sulfotransferase family protein [Pseudomonas borbori]|uniref:Tetratricopeptide repeat-containing protein n=1 Tax=Pseudomonas borbori TaxID=289003 RepID=A0A1I5U125_9PSED|nr:tetratricopeptide repeat-containing sulfotransferase family protein [Pseudomonas borbori]SFP89000.1 Tetratricopeptide repeat-containing protein [Pseudomonas borbori]
MMLSILRGLADRQDFPALRGAAEAAWEDSADPACLALLAFAQAQLGEFEEAGHALSGLLELIDRLDCETRVDLGAVCLSLGRVDEAGALLEAVLAVQPGHSLALARLAWCRMQQGRVDQALELYQRSAAVQPRQAVLLSIAQLHLQMDHAPGALEALELAANLWTEQADEWPEPLQQYHQARLHRLQLEVWLAAGQQAEVEAWLAARRSALPEQDWCALLQGYAQLLQGGGQHAQAEDALREGLKHCPQHLPLYSQLAEIAALQGRTAQAAALLRRAIRLAEEQEDDLVPLWVRLSSLLLQHNPIAARQAAERAMALVDSLAQAGRGSCEQLGSWRVQAELALAGVESHELHYVEAEQRYQSLLEKHPGLLAALIGLGQLRMQLGRIDEAVTLFARASEIDPARGHAALINARHFPDDVATLEQLERLARMPGPEGRVRSGLLFSLAAAWEKRKDYAKAFVLADEANTASRKLLNYDPVAHRQRCARIRHAFNRELYEHRGGLGNHSTLPVFVLGMPRSGTTLIEQILAGHSQIHGAGELGVIPGVIAGLERWERRVGSGRHYPDCVDDLSAKVVAGITGNILKELQEYAPEALHVVDKLPHNFENIGLIKLLFPNARIISVRRDPRDIAISNYFTDYAAKHGGMGFAYDLTWIGEQLADHNLLLQHWDQVFPGEILQVRYEDVLADPEREARRMLAYVGVAWEPQVLNFSELQRPVKTASVWQVRQPLYTTSMAKWARYEAYLAPLIRGTNARIEWQPITDMVTLPVPGLLETGVAFYREERLDDAEYHFKQLLHHLPEHAAATFMVGLIYVRKGHLDEGIALMLKAHEQCPWNGQWRDDLAQAYEMAGEPEKAALLKRKKPHSAHASVTDNEHEIDGEFAW